MAENKEKSPVSNDANENLCVVCFKDVEIYSIGVCDHAVCFECSTRMRVLCKQMECPICRGDMPKVIFTKTIEPFSTLFPKFEKSNLNDQKYGLYFCTLEIKKTYQKLLEHRCKICDRDGNERSWPFPTFQKLKDHMRLKHELFYCDICVQNLKIFSSERRCYNRQELGHHRRKGDVDDKSHKGHPICEFCDVRYMDNDELFRHLRRTHLFCHICDADGKHQYYRQLDDLRQHFREEHFLCEEGDCIQDPLTSAFRTSIDLKAHIAAEHSKFKSKAASKQARTLELEFTLAPRHNLLEGGDGSSRNRSGMGRGGTARRNRDPAEVMEAGNGPGGGGSSTSSSSNAQLNMQDFPALGGGATALPLSTTVNFISKVNNARLNRDDFPTLGSTSGRNSSAVTITTNSGRSGSASARPEVTITRTVLAPQSTTSNRRKVEDFPALGGTSSSLRLSVNNNSSNNYQNGNNDGAKLSIHITTSSGNQKPSTSREVEAFPALGRPESNKNASQQPQWVVVQKKQEKQQKVAPCPQLPPSDLLTDFPSLGNTSGTTSKSTKLKKSTVTLETSNSWTENSSRDSSKDKKDCKISQQTTVSQQIDKKNKKSKKLETNNNSESAVKENNKNNENNVYTKKRSELKIGTLINSNNVVKPPPGFSGTTQSSSSTSSLKPPPGFSSSTPQDFPSISSSPNDLTFTNSSGQSYTITPNKNVYISPANFQQRNQNLIKQMMKMLNNNDQVVSEFKTYSDLFRKGTLPADKYYSHCKSVLGSKFEEVFPELLVLLPDIEKQQQLYNVTGAKVRKNLIVCETCRQIIFKWELSQHYMHHQLDNQFPSLGTATLNSNNNSNVWNK